MNKIDNIFYKLDNKYFIYIVLIIALILRLYNLNYAGLWNDELFTAFTANPNNSIKAVIHFLKYDIHPPLHNIICNLWSKVFSFNDTSLRVLNILIGVWGVLSVYHLAKLLFNKKVAFYAIALAALNYYLIRYSQEVRPYGLLILLSNYSFLYFVKLVKEEFTFKNSIWYVVVTTSLLYTHYFAVFVIAGQFVTFFFIMDWSKFKQAILKYSVTFALPGLLFAIWLPTILDHLERKTEPWRDVAGLNLIFKYSQDFFNDYILSFISVILFFFTVLYLLIIKFFKNKRIENFFSGMRVSLLILIIWIAVYFLIPFIRSIFSDTMMVNRYFTPLVTPILLIFAFYFSKIENIKIKKSVFTTILCYSVLLLFLNESPYYTRSATYREIAKEAKKINSDAHVLCLAKNGRYFEYYLWQNNIRKTSSRFDIFSKMIKENYPDEYFVFLNLRPIPQKYKEGIPKVEGYKMTSSKIFKNKSGIHSTKLFRFSKIKDSLQE